MDDFATRKGYKYGTILVDMVSRRPVDVLADREAATLTAWLREHSGVEIICRDRDGAYAKGAREGAPQAIQVADRFHLWANLGEAVEKTVIAHRHCLVEPDIDTVASAVVVEPTEADTAPLDAVADVVGDNTEALPGRDEHLDVCGRPRRLVARSIERFEAVQRLRAQGMSLRAICRALQLDRKTVRRFADAATLQELLFKATHRVGKLDAFKPYLDHRISQGCTNAVVLHAELRERGYTGSDQTVRRYLAPFRSRAAGRPRNATTRPAMSVDRPAPPKPRQVASWIMTNPDNLKPGKALQLKQILARCPELDALARHVAAFADIMCHLRGDQIETWMNAVAADDLPALHSLLTGLRRDLHAVTAGLTLPWNSGAVEGHVNRIKMIKRQMFGRANFDLLRKRILLAS